MKVPAQRPRKTPCKLAFLGEAPGTEEIQRGGQYLKVAREVWYNVPWTGDTAADFALVRRHGLPPLPLVGPSGRVFNAILRAAGVRREDCWVGNVFEEKAPGNDVSEWVKNPDIAVPALERLCGELDEAKPTVIVPMGATPLWALTGRTDIAKMRGSPMLANCVAGGAKLLPTYHPAFVLRQWKNLPLVIGDVERAVREAEKGPGLTYPWREFTLEPDLGTVRCWVHGCRGQDGRLSDSQGDDFRSLLTTDLLSVDIETGWGQITCIGFAPDHEHAICVPFVDLREPSRSYWKSAEEEAEVWALVKTVMESSVPKLGQNFSYDAFWLLEKMGIKSMNYLHDTRLMHHAIAAELPKDLGSLAAAYSEMPQWKSWASRKEEKRDA